MWHGRSALGRGTLVGAAFALTLSVQSGALAQTPAAQSNAPAPAPVKQAGAPKQVGLWTVIGWNRGNAASHCSAERPVRGAVQDGSALQFALVRWSGGYRIALGSDEWELTPQTAFPVELIAAPVFRSEANALAIGPKIVMIELGSDGQFMQKLSTAAAIEIKTAQTTFRLPLEGFGSALAEVDTCFGALKRPNANPFAAPATAPKQSALPPQTNVPAPGAAPATVTKVNAVAVNAPPAPPRATASLDGDLIEERTFLTVETDKGPYRLETLIVRPAKADGPLPIALITHGKNLKSEDNRAIRADMMPAAGSPLPSSGAATANRTGCPACRAAPPTWPARPATWCTGSTSRRTTSTARSRRWQRGGTPTARAQSPSASRSAAPQCSPMPRAGRPA
jgi:hypothetical protein